jgi:hypothetical protein
LKAFFHKRFWATRFFIKLLLCCTFICAVNIAARPPAADYRMHCLYLYKFSQLIKWPQPETAKEFTIGVVGISPFLPVLEQYIAAKNASSPVKYKLIRFATAQQVTDCHLLYVTKEQTGGFEMLVKKFDGKPVLLVTEVGGLIKRGAGINFIYEEGASIKVQINKAAIESHNLKITPGLLKLGAEIF